MRNELKQHMAQLERARIVGALTRASGIVTVAARAIGMSPSTVWRRIRKYGIRPEIYRQKWRKE
jgi:transcriptional regulator of acetoin/glycerol metabolism